MEGTGFSELFRKLIASMTRPPRINNSAFQSSSSNRLLSSLHFLRLLARGLLVCGVCMFDVIAGMQCGGICQIWHRAALQQRPLYPGHAADDACGGPGTQPHSR